MTFTFEELLELPRPSPAVLNPSRTRALWPCTTFSFAAADGKGRTEKFLSLVDLCSQSETKPQTVLEHLHFLEAVWIDDDTFLFLRPPYVASSPADSQDAGSTKQAVRPADHPVDISDKKQGDRMKEIAEKDAGVEVWAKNVSAGGGEYRVGRLPVAISDLKAVSTGKDSAVLAFSATVYPDGDIYTVKKQDEESEKEANGSEGMVYDALFVRHWSEWKPTKGQLKQLHLVRLERPAQSDKWSIVSETGSPDRAAVSNPLKGTKLECPVGPFGSADDYDLSTAHLVFHAKDSELNPAWHTRTQVYVVDLSNNRIASPVMITVGSQGACSNPSVSPDGKRIAWLEMREGTASFSFVSRHMHSPPETDGYEADRRRVMLYDIESGRRTGTTEDWDRSPHHLTWCSCSQELYLTAEEKGHTKVFHLEAPLGQVAASGEPVALTQRETVASISPVDCERAVVTMSSFTSPNSLFTLTKTKNAQGQAELRALARLVPDLASTKSLSRSEEFWFKGSEDEEVHGFILFPPGEDDAEVRKTKGKRPVMFLIHGGPQGSWSNGFSARWSLNMFAAQGYITVAVNPCGSTGYGQKFCDDIKQNWGGRPFKDLVAGLAHVKKTYPEIDPDAIAIQGSSFGGFMANWWNGHNDSEDTKIACLVNHAGLFNLSSVFYNTEELYFPEREFGGTPWQSREIYDRWNPERHVSKWRIPTLLIHGGKDYRLTECESISAFNTLQRLKVPSRFLYFPSENHECLDNHNVLKWFQEVSRWTNHWTGAAKA